MTRPTLFLLAALCAAAAALTAAGPTAVAATTDCKPAKGATLPVVRIVTARTAATSLWWGLGYVAPRFGFKTTYTQVGTFADMQRALVAGQADAGSLGYNNPAIMADLGIRNVKIVAGAWTGSQNLIAKTGSGIQSWADLEGKSVGVIPGSYAYIMFVVAAREHKVNLDKVKLVNLAPIPATLNAALAKGQIDALVWVAPILQQIEDAGIAYSPRGINILDNAGLGGAPDGLMAATTSFIQKGDLYQCFMNAWVYTLRYYQKHPTRWAKFISVLTGVDLKIAQRSVGSGRNQAGINLRISRSGLVGAAHLGPAFGYTRSDQSSKVLGYLDLRALAKAMGVKTNGLLVR